MNFQEKDINHSDQDAAGTAIYKYRQSPDDTDIQDTRYWPIRKGDRISSASAIILTSTASATENKQSLKNLQSVINSIFEEAKTETFEYGIESEFARKLDLLIYKYGDMVIEVLQRLVFQDDADIDVGYEALRVIGRAEHESSHISRLRLLQRGLFSSVPQIRNGSALGLAYLDDPKAIPFLMQAIERETIEWLREYFQQVNDQLENTLKCQTSSGS